MDRKINSLFKIYDYDSIFQLDNNNNGFIKSDKEIYLLNNFKITSKYIIKDDKSFNYIDYIFCNLDEKGNGKLFISKEKSDGERSKFNLYSLNVSNFKNFENEKIISEKEINSYSSFWYSSNGTIGTIINFDDKNSIIYSTKQVMNIPNSFLILRKINDDKVEIIDGYFGQDKYINSSPKLIMNVDKNGNGWSIDQEDRNGFNIKRNLSILSNFKPVESKNILSKDNSETIFDRLSTTGNGFIIEDEKSNSDNKSSYKSEPSILKKIEMSNFNELSSEVIFKNDGNYEYYNSKTYMIRILPRRYFHFNEKGDGLAFMYKILPDDKRNIVMKVFENFKEKKEVLVSDNSKDFISNSSLNDNGNGLIYIQEDHGPGELIKIQNYNIEKPIFQ